MVSSWTDLILVFRGIPNYNYRKGKITFIRTTRQTNGNASVSTLCISKCRLRIKCFQFAYRLTHRFWNLYFLICFILNINWSKHVIINGTSVVKSVRHLLPESLYKNILKFSLFSYTLWMYRHWFWVLIVNFFIFS